MHPRLWHKVAEIEPPSGVSLLVCYDPTQLVPAILIAFAIYGLFSRWVFQRTGHPWAGACANALAFSWLVAVSFPVVAR